MLNKLMNVGKIGALCLILTVIGHWNQVNKDNDIKRNIKVTSIHDVAKEQMVNFEDKDFEYISVCLSSRDRHDIWDLTLKFDGLSKTSKWWKEDDIEYELFWNDDNAWLCRFDYENDRYYVFTYQRPYGHYNEEKSV